MKKLLSLFIICLMAAALMAGCSSDEASSDGDTQIKEVNPQEDREDVPQQHDEAAIISDEQLLWINAAYAILTVLNGGDLTVFGGAEPSTRLENEWQGTLDAWWGIDGQEELIYMVDTLTLGRHNPRFLEEVAEYGLNQMTEEELLYELQYVEEESAFFFYMMFTAYDAFGDNAIMGWDLSRAVQLCGQGYLAGYFTYEEAVGKARSVGKVIQQTFDSWEDFWDSYLLGYYWWSEDINDLYERIDVYEALAADPNGPFSLEWLLDLN